jgi:hypothetical protein
MLVLNRALPTFSATHAAVMFSLSFYQKFPPGPVYVAFFGGAGMLLVASILEMARRGIQPFLLNTLRQIGLASLFVYLLQYYLYTVIIRGLRLPYSPLWPLLLVLSVALLALAAALWNRQEGNRFLTVGIGPFLNRRAERKGSVLAPQLPLASAAATDRSLATDPVVGSPGLA